jgi:hypothetical protein
MRYPADLSAGSLVISNKDPSAPDSRALRDDGSRGQPARPGFERRATE